MEAIEKAAAQMWMALCDGKRLRPSECRAATVSAIAAFLRAWEPSDEAVWASQLAPDTTQNRRQIKLGMKAAAVSDAGTIERAMTATTGTAAGKP